MFVVFNNYYILNSMIPLLEYLNVKSAEQNNIYVEFRFYCHTLRYQL